MPRKSAPFPRPATNVPQEYAAETAIVPSPTAVAVEALATGVIPLRVLARPQDIPGENEVLQVGDPDDEAIRNAYVGDETPGGDMPTPDQNQVDDIGRAYGVQEEDTGSLRTSSELLDKRDRRRGFQDVPPTRWE